MEGRDFARGASSPALEDFIQDFDDLNCRLKWYTGSYLEMATRVLRRKDSNTSRRLKSPVSPTSCCLWVKGFAEGRGGNGKVV